MVIDSNLLITRVKKNKNLSIILTDGIRNIRSCKIKNK